MVRKIMKDPLFLCRKSEPATLADVQVGKDLLETLIAHKEECVGMAANMIGELKNIIAINNCGMFMLMYNPVILAKQGSYEVMEGCLSLSGERKATRYEKIKVQFQDAMFKTHVVEFEDFEAQIIQHEVDHCNGILIWVIGQKELVKTAVTVEISTVIAVLSCLKEDRGWTKRVGENRCKP